MRKLKGLAVLIVFIALAAFAYAQMYGWQRYWVSVVNPEGEPATGLLVSVYDAGTSTMSTLATDRTASETYISAMPVDSKGFFGFWYKGTSCDITITETPTSKTVLKVSGFTPNKHKVVFYPEKLSSIGTVSASALTASMPLLSFGTLNELTDSDTQPVVSKTFYKSGTTTATINNFCSGANGSETGLVAGQLLIIQSKGAITFDVTSSGIVGGTTDIVTQSGDITTFVYDGTSWNVISRMSMSDDLNSDSVAQ